MKIITLLFITLSAFTFREPAVSYKIDLKQSSVHWTGYYSFSFGEHTGTINLTKGELSMTGDQLTGGNFQIDMNSLQDTDMPANDGGNDLTDHLKGDDFFSTTKFPSALFEITKVEKVKDATANQPSYDITGILTLKGIKNQLKFPASITSDGSIVNVKAKFKFDRTKWNIRYNSGKFFSDIGDGAISDAIGIELSLLATK